MKGDYSALKYAHILKTAAENTQPNMNETLKQINKFTRRPLTEDEVFIFSVILCDNEIDRDFEQFSDNSLYTLKSLFLGKTGVFDHVPTGSNQTARIFFTDVITDSCKKNSTGQPYKYLLAKAYMVKSSKNKDLILEIDAGIKKEISVGCAIKSKICSICGANHKINPCSHTPGKTYNVNGLKSTCYLTLEQPLDAYEWSFVAVPAQVNAGVIKNFKNPTATNLNTITTCNIEKIKKQLETTQTSCFISAASATYLTKYISKLEANSATANEFIADLKNSVYKMLTVSQPILTSSAIKNIVNNLTYSELKELKFNLIKELNQTHTSPQLTPIEQTSVEPNLDENNMFKI